MNADLSADHNSTFDILANNSLLEHIYISEKWLNANYDLLLSYAVNIFFALGILIIGNFASNLISRNIAKILNRKNIDLVIIEFIQNLIRYVILALVLIAALSSIGINTASIVAVIGAAGLAIGLALQGSLSNFAAGVIIIAFRPFKAGNLVQIGNITGYISAIYIFQTILRTQDNKRVIIPNSSVISGSIINFSHYDTRRIDLIIGVSYNANLQHAIDVIYATLEKDPRILKDPAIKIGVNELAASSVNLAVRPWCNTREYRQVYFDSLKNIKEALDLAGIEIPYPQMELHLKKD